MSSIDSIIYDALLRKQDVALPEVGYLNVKRMPARRMSDNRIAPPRNAVAFTPDEVPGAVSVITLLTGGENIGEEEAWNRYNSWLEAARSDDSLHIEGVGDIRDGKFIALRPFHVALNPAGERVVTLESRDEDERKGGSLWVWIIVGVLLAAAALAILSYYGKGFSGFRKKPDAVTVTTVVPETAADTVTVVAQPVAEKPALPRFHVIVGSFAVESNADNLMKTLEKTHPDLDVTKLRSRWNGNWLVSILAVPTEREAYNALYKHLDIDPFIWVYPER